MWPLSLVADCLIASSKSYYSNSPVHPLLYILLVWFFSPSFITFFFFYHTSLSIIYSLYSILLPLCQFSPCGSPSCPLHLDLLFSLSNSISCLCVYALVPSSPSFSPSSSHACHTSFSFSSLHSPPVFSSPSLFSVSVEPLWLHRYTDCWLCRWGGMLFRHSTRRYCTSARCPLQPKLLHQTSHCTVSILHWGCNMKYKFPCTTGHGCFLSTNSLGIITINH